jgi:hypothetical protein
MEVKDQLHDLYALPSGIESLIPIVDGLFREGRNVLAPSGFEARSPSLTPVAIPVELSLFQRRLLK